VLEAHRAGILPSLPHPTQLAFLVCPEREAMYGGAAGGGKSEALLAGAALFHDVPGYSAILFRRTHTDLAQPGALMDRSHTWWRNRASWDGTNKIWRFPSGAKVALAYMAGPEDHLRYQSAEYQYIGFDEVTQFPEHQVLYVGLSRLRRLAGVEIPLRLRAGTNPGGPGHLWVKKRYVNPGDPGRPFFPARIQDNPSLDQKSYIEALQGLHPTTRAQLLAGDWEAREPGDYFRREWFGPLVDVIPPMHLSVRIRWWDLAASEREADDKGQRARTAGVKMSKAVGGVYTIEHALAFWKTPGARDDLIFQTAQADGHGCAVGIEQEPGSGGIAQAETLAKRLRRSGYRVVIEPATANKESRADPVASELERGWSRGWDGCGVRCLVGAWTEEYLDEVQGFPDADLLDQADATASAFNWLKPQPVTGLLAPAEAASKPPPPHHDEIEHSGGESDRDEEPESERSRKERSRLIGLAATRRYGRESNRRW
jgi:phage terminase large subunit-like protein